MALFTLKRGAHPTDHLGFIKESHPFYLYFLTFLVGIISSFATIGFIKFYQLLTRFIYNGSSSDFTEIAQNTPLWHFFLILVVGGALIGLIIFYFIPYYGHGQGFPHLLYSYRHMSYITPTEGISSTIAATLSLAVGASVGREMPAIFFSASLTSWLCRLLRIKGHLLRVLIAAAIGTSLATSFHSSFVGIFFVIELVSFSLTTLDLLPITLAIFTGVFIREYFIKIFPTYALKFAPYDPSIPILNLFILGILSGLLAYLFLKTLSFTIRSSHYSRLPKWMWPMLGGLGLALLAIRYPSVLGLGLVEMSLLAELSTSFIPTLFLLLAKYLAILFSIGFGFSGGVLTPSVFLGLAIGSLYAATLASIFPHYGISHEMLVIAAGAAFTSVVLGAPVTMTMLSFEVTHDIQLTLNVFIVVFFAQVTMKVLNLNSFFHNQYKFLYDDCG